jgi:hypothetical protein
MFTLQSQIKLTFHKKHQYSKLQDWLKANQWKHFLLFPKLGLLSILFLYGGLLLPTVGHQGISWDEQTDIEVARAYLESPDGWFVGSSLDPSQTRLPAFVVALVYGVISKYDLYTARLVSCLVGALTIIAVYFYGAKRYNYKTGLFACALLASSPFYLAFAQVAFTETDIYLACMLAWLLVSVDRMQDQPSIGRSAIVGILLGLAMSAKFTALAVFPAVLFVVWQAKGQNPDRYSPQVQWFETLFWVIWEVLFVIGGVYLVNMLPPAFVSGISLPYLYLIVFSGWLLTLAWSGYRRRYSTSWLVMGLFITGLALLTFVVVPPEHLTNPGILKSLFYRFQHEKSANPNFPLEAMALHFLCIFLKSSPVIGAGLLLSLILSTVLWRLREYGFPVLVVWLYLGCLAMLPIAQTFYTVPLLPVLSIFAASQFTRLYSRQRMIAIGVGILAAGLLIFDLSLCYPDYNLNGYQWVGERMLAGRPSVGYRSVVQTPSDGVEQVMEWLNENAKPGERVRTFLLPWHIVQAVAPNPVYKLENGLQGQLFPEPDYVVVAINAQIRQSWWIDSSVEDIFRPIYNPAWLDSKYDKIFTVKRAFGIEMASVFRKK